MTEQNNEVNPFEEKVYDQRPQDVNGRPVKHMVVFRAASGRFKRMLKRNQTIHTEYICDKCGGRVRFKKDIPVGNGKYEHNKWVCLGCGTMYHKEEK